MFYHHDSILHVRMYVYVAVSCTVVLQSELDCRHRCVHLLLLHGEIQGLSVVVALSLHGHNWRIIATACVLTGDREFRTI